MKRANTVVAIIVVAMIALFSIAVAEVPQVISYQGRLTDGAGDPVANGDYLIKFTIYDSEIADNDLWSSNYREVTVSDGLFSYMLGDTVALPAGLFEADTLRWLGIKVQANEEIRPLTKFTTVAYAYHAKTADTAAHATSIADNAVSSSKIQNGTILFEDIGLNDATDGQIIKYNEGASAWEAADASTGSSNWSVTDSVLYTNNYLGIARGGAENMMYGNKSYTHVNLGAVCTTGTSGTNINFATVSGGLNNAATESYSTIGGGQGNVASTIYATVSGGRDNTAFDGGSTVSGGIHNTADGYGSSVGGGQGNFAHGSKSRVSGGASDTASGDYSTVSGGSYNTASGESSTVSGGSANTASGTYSYAAGRRAKAIHDGAFVWGDDTSSDVSSSALNQFTARTTGGARFFTNSGLTTGVQLAAGGGSWASVSDRSVKENIRPVEGNAILEKISQLEISRWNYETQDESIEHIGPMAQDFYRLFGVGDNNTTITSIDPDGISLAAIKALLERIEVLEQRITELEER